MKSTEVAPDANDRVDTARRPSAVIRTAILGAVVVAGAALLGPARFTGLRWLPKSPPATSRITAPPAQPPAPHRTLPPRLHTGNPLTIDLSLVAWVALGLAVLAVAFFLIRFIRRRNWSRMPGHPADDALNDVDTPWDEEVIVPIVRRGLANALRILAEDRDPHDAIVHAWLGLQEAAEDSGIVRADAETPTEFTRRILGSVSTDDAAITTILDLYLRVRFGEYRATGSDIAAARQAVSTLSSRWRAPTANGLPGTDGDE